MTKWSTSGSTDNIIDLQRVKQTTPEFASLDLDFIGSAPPRTESYEEDKAFSSFIKPPKEPEIIIQGHTDEVLEAAKKEAYERGYNQGIEEGIVKGKTERFEIDQILSTSFADMDQTLKHFLQSFESHLKESRKDTERLAHMIGEKIATNALDENSFKNIEALIEKCMGFIINEPSVTISVHPSLIDTLKEYIEQHEQLSQLSKKPAVVGDEKCAQTDCNIAWEDGGAELNIAKRWQQIEEILGKLPELTTSEEEENAPTDENHEAQSTETINSSTPDEKTTSDEIEEQNDPATDKDEQGT